MEWEDDAYNAPPSGKLNDLQDFVNIASSKNVPRVN
jgi:hypothetical protein